ncbi:MAG: hypothetical protein S4CHLAM6_12200 [Chlamydiae bacterium]|nr:hypothetical protein [Chlamydiota bacterium]
MVALVDPNNRFSPLILDTVGASKARKKRSKESHMDGVTFESPPRKRFKAIATSPQISTLTMEPAPALASIALSPQKAEVETRDASVQTDEVVSLVEDVATTALEIVDAPKLAPSEYSLENLDIAVVNVHEPYEPEAGDKIRNPDSWLTAKMKGLFDKVADSVYWKVKSIAHKVRSSFVQTEYELLMALNDPNQQIRAWKSWTSIANSKPREQLYGLSNGLIRSVILDPVLGFLWNEGIKRSDAFNTLEILKAVPDILFEDLNRLNSVINVELEPLLSKAAVVLRDVDYSNIHYLEQLEGELHDAVGMLELQTSKLVISGLDNVEGVHEAISKKLKSMKTENFPSFQSAFDARFKVSFLDVKRDEAFKFGSDLAKKVSSVRTELSAILLDLPKATVADKKRRIHAYTEKLLEYKKFAIELLRLNKIFVDDFERKLALPASRATMG